MRRLITLVAPLALLVLGGCSTLRDAASLPSAAGSAPTAEVSGVRVEVDAPGDLRALLMRHLDLTRLGTLSRGDTVSDGEWSRLIDAAPMQVAELLRTEGYFSPDVQVARANQTASGRAQDLRVKVEPGPRTTVSRVTLEVDGPLQGAAVMASFAAGSAIGLVAAPWLWARLARLPQAGAMRLAGAMLAGASAWALAHGFDSALAWCAPS